MGQITVKKKTVKEKKAKTLVGYSNYFHFINGRVSSERNGIFIDTWKHYIRLIEKMFYFVLYSYEFFTLLKNLLSVM